MRVREPEDLVQSTIELAIRHSSQLRDDEKLWPWLVAIQAHEAFRWSRRVRETVGWPQAREPEAREPASHDLERFAELRDALDALPPRMRASVVLHHMADLTVAETARALGTSENTVKSQLRLGLKRLKESMA
jgi:RNA polymerase sigma factor, sigma-70 family